MVYYLASPYSVDADYELMRLRYKCVMKKTAELTREGFAVFSPIVNSHILSTRYAMPTTFDFWAKIDYEFIAVCSEVWVYKMDGWEDSVGVQKEIEYAQSLGKTVKYIECEDSPPARAYKARMKDISKSKPLYGVGINDVWYSPTQVKRVSEGRGQGCFKAIWHCIVYQRWANTLKRCYDEKNLLLAPSYEGCTMVEEWHSFSNFKAWHDINFVPEWHLDKDILKDNNKIYGPDSCVFVPVYLNQILAVNTSGKCLPGVNKRVEKWRTKPYHVSHEFGSIVKRKDFATEEEAHGWWCEQRAESIRWKLRKYNLDERGMHKETVTERLEALAKRLVELKSWDKAYNYSENIADKVA